MIMMKCLIWRKNEGSVICDYYEKYTRTWSESYYHNVKEKIKPLIRD